MKMTTFEQHAHDLAPAMKMMRDNDTLALCARLQAAAIRCDDYHVFIEYMAHVRGVYVRAYEKTTNYNGNQVPLIEEYTYLDVDYKNPIADLNNIIDQLQRLGIDV